MSGEVVAAGSGSGAVEGSMGEGVEGKHGGLDGAGVDVLFVPAGCLCPMCRSVYSKIAFTLPTT